MLIKMPTSAKHTQKEVISRVISKEATFQFHTNTWDLTSPVPSGAELLNIHCDITATQPILYAWFP